LPPLHFQSTPINKMLQRSGAEGDSRHTSCEERERGIAVSLRTLERAVAPFRAELEAEARATLRFETPPGRQLQIDFGQKRVAIAGVTVPVFLFVATLGYSRLLYVQPFRHERQSAWLTGLEAAFRQFGGG